MSEPRVSFVSIAVEPGTPAIPGFPTPGIPGHPLSPETPAQAAKLKVSFSVEFGAATSVTYLPTGFMLDVHVPEQSLDAAVAQARKILSETFEKLAQAAAGPSTHQ